MSKSTLRGSAALDAVEQQAANFLSALRSQGWRIINHFGDEGHDFTLLAKGSKTVLFQKYPGGHGFEVWRPVTSSATIAETAVAVEAYALEPNPAA